MTDPAVLKYHIELARASGVDGFVVDWHGVNNPLMNRQLIASILIRLLKLAGVMSFTVAINYNAPMTYFYRAQITNRALALQAMRDDLTFVLKEFATSGAYLEFQDLGLDTSIVHDILSNQIPGAGGSLTAESPRVTNGWKSSIEFRLAMVEACLRLDFDAVPVFSDYSLTTRDYAPKFIDSRRFTDK